MQLRNYKPIGLSHVKFTYQRISNTVLSNMLEKKIPKTLKCPCYHLLGCREDVHHSSEAALEQVFLGSWDKDCGTQDCRSMWDLPFCLILLPHQWSPAQLGVPLPQILLSGDQERSEGQMQWRSEYLSLRMQRTQRQIHFGPDFWVGSALSRRLDKMTLKCPFPT